MALITLDEAKNYLRVDTSDDDSLIGVLLSSACRLCADVARLTDEQWAVVDGGDDEDELYTEDELSHVQEIMKVAISYSIGYLYEHREEADHHDLTITLRSLLFDIREGVW
ncbi:MAG: head-tail connector protein [Oscillospiraceae bacterium]|nr:head-tail connector protein [Oscillospiraceae bacterium]